VTRRTSASGSKRALVGRVFEVRRTPMPDGGFVVTCTDQTDRASNDQLARKVAAVLGEPEARADNVIPMKPKG
jgi:hypothetical protein